MQDSKTPLLKWYKAIFLIEKVDMGGRDLSRVLDLTQKTTWLMRKKIVYVMDNPSKDIMPEYDRIEQHMARPDYLDSVAYVADVLGIPVEDIIKKEDLYQTKLSQLKLSRLCLEKK